MTLSSRLLNLFLIALVLATSTGVERGCGTAAEMERAQHAGHHPGTPVGRHGDHHCPVLPGSACQNLSGCLATGAPPAAQEFVLAPEPTSRPVATALPVLLPRDITPDTPPPRT